MAPWQQRDKLYVEDVITTAASSSHRDGLVLLFGAVGLLLLVFASGSTFRLLTRMDARLRTG